MCKAFLPKLIITLVLALSIVLAGTSVTAAEQETLPFDNSSLPPGEITVDGLDLPAGIPTEELGSSPVLNPYTNTVISGESEAPEATLWERIYPILIDIAIGAGAGIIVGGIWWSYKEKKWRHKMNQKSADHFEPQT